VSTLPVDLLADCLTFIFVETGSWDGGGIQLAVDTGFPEIHSVEVDRGCYENCCKMFSDLDYIYLYHGESTAMLSRLLPTLTSPMTFWLDAHAGNAPTNGSELVPLLSEIDVVAKYFVPGSIILVDDCRLMGSGNWEDVSKEKVLEKLLKIPELEITIHDSISYPNDIIMAK